MDNLNFEQQKQIFKEIAEINEQIELLCGNYALSTQMFEKMQKNQRVVSEISKEIIEALNALDM